MKKKFWKVLTAGTLACALLLPFAGCSSGKGAAESAKMPQSLSVSLAQQDISLQQINAVEAGRLTNLAETTFVQKNETLYKDNSQSVYAFDTMRRFTFYHASQKQNLLQVKKLPASNQQLKQDMEAMLKDLVPHIGQFEVVNDPTVVDSNWKSLTRTVGRGEADYISVHYQSGTLDSLTVEYCTENDAQIPEAKKKTLDEQAQNAVQALKKKNGADKVEISYYKYILSGKDITGTYHLKSSWNNPNAPDNPAQDVQTFTFSVAK